MSTSLHTLHGIFPGQWTGQRTLFVWSTVVHRNLLVMFERFFQVHLFPAPVFIAIFSFCTILSIMETQPGGWTKTTRSSYELLSFRHTNIGLQNDNDQLVPPSTKLTSTIFFFFRQPEIRPTSPSILPHGPGGKLKKRSLEKKHFVMPQQAAIPLQIVVSKQRKVTQATNH